MEALRLQARPSALREPIVEPAQVCHFHPDFLADHGLGSVVGSNQIAKQSRRAPEK
jgi:hypothetical protein